MKIRTKEEIKATMTPEDIDREVARLFAETAGMITKAERKPYMTQITILMKAKIDLKVEEANANG